MVPGYRTHLINTYWMNKCQRGWRSFPGPPLPHWEMPRSPSLGYKYGGLGQAALRSQYPLWTGHIRAKNNKNKKNVLC